VKALAERDPGRSPRQEGPPHAKDGRARTRSVKKSVKKRVKKIVKQAKKRG